MSYSLDGLSNMSSLYFTVVLFVKRRSYYTCIGIVIFFLFWFPYIDNVVWYDGHIKVLWYVTRIKGWTF